MPDNKQDNNIVFKQFSGVRPGEIYSLLFESYSDLIRDYPTHCAEWQRTWKEYDADIFAQPHTVGECGFVTPVDGKIAGFASYDPRGRAESALVGLNCLLFKFRNRGVGKRQLRELLRILRQRGFRKVEATTCDHPFFAPARRMYASCGFKETGLTQIDPASVFRTIRLVCELSTLIRPVSTNDFDDILALFRQLWPVKALNAERQWVVYTAMLESTDYELLCAEMDASIIGFASLSIQYNFWQEGTILYITTMIVDERHRWQGVGSALIREIEMFAKEKGCRKIELESAFHRTEAHAFYEKMGFEKRAYFYSMDVN